MTTTAHCYAGAGIATDGSVGSRQTIAGANAGAGNFSIPQTLGSLSGNNLFHSFSTFNIDTGQSATFTTTTPSIANVISRVTGGSLSQINGQLKLTPASGAPNFFFINPAGVTFGAGASIDVPSAFHVGTADYIKFPDGNFHADLNKASTLSSARPEAFGFLGATRTTITIKDRAELKAYNPQQPISIVAGDITISNNANITSYSDGGIRVVAIGQKTQEIEFFGTLPVAFGDLTIKNGGNIGSIASEKNAGPIQVSAGNITIDPQGGGRYGISSSTYDQGNSSDIDISATGTLNVVNNGSIHTFTESPGAAGNIKVRADSIILGSQEQGYKRSGFIRSESDWAGGINPFGLQTTGSLGTVEVIATGNLSILNGSRISSSTATPANAGAVTVSAGSININGYGTPTGIYSETSTVYDYAKKHTDSGNAGSINVSTTGKLSIASGGYISSSTSSSGNAGAIKVSAGSIDIDGSGPYRAAGIESNANVIYITEHVNAGNAGSIDVSTTGKLSIASGGHIATSSRSSGNAGAIKISAGSIDIISIGAGIFSNASDGYKANPGTGNGGNIDISATGNISIINDGENSSGISSFTVTSGNAGTIKVRAASLMLDRAFISTSCYFGYLGNGIYSNDTGHAGNIDISTTGNLSIVNTGYISSSTWTMGNAGNINVSATGNLSIVNGGYISSDTFSPGNAGSVKVSAGTLRVDGTSWDGWFSTISAAALEGSSGQTGSVIVAANDITLSNGGQISIANEATIASPSTLIPTAISVTAPHITLLNSPNAITTKSTGNVAAGSIKISSDKLFLYPGSSITTTSNLGNGGAIDITGGALWLDNSQIATSVTGLTGNGGNITIAANVLAMNTGFIQANTAAANASGGLVSISAQSLIPSGKSLFLGGSAPYTFQPGVFGYNVIQAAAPTGVSGVIQVSAPTLDVSASLVGLNTGMMKNDQLARSPCENTGGSSLSSVGRGGLPPGAQDFLSPSQFDSSFIASPSTMAVIPAVKTATRLAALSPCLGAL